MAGHEEEVGFLKITSPRVDHVDRPHDKETLHVNAGGRRVFSRYRLIRTTPVTLSRWEVAFKSNRSIWAEKPVAVSISP